MSGPSGKDMLETTPGALSKEENKCYAYPCKALEKSCIRYHKDKCS